MLIAVIGLQSSGCDTVRRHLVQDRGFTPIGLKSHGTAKGRRRPEGKEGTFFDDESALLDYATAHWSEPLVIWDAFEHYEQLEAFRKRPFFLLVSVAAPAYTRWMRILGAKGDGNAIEGDLASAMRRDDEALYRPLRPVSSDLESSSMTRESSTGVIATLANMIMDASQPNGSSQRPETDHSDPAHQPLSLYALMQSADLRLVNNFPALDGFQRHLTALDLSSTHRLRPTWDTYFLSLCTLASLRSNCMKRRVGAVLVRNNRVLSTGYNGTPRGLKNCNEGGCARCNGRLPGQASSDGAPQVPKSGVGLDECVCLHAEENALLECGRERGGAEGTVLYCNTCPCLRCSVKIVQTGVKEVVYQLEYSMDDRSREIFTAAGVIFRKYTPPV